MISLDVAKIWCIVLFHEKNRPTQSTVSKINLDKVNA